MYKYMYKYIRACTPYRAELTIGDRRRDKVALLKFLTLRQFFLNSPGIKPLDISVASHESCKTFSAFAHSQ